MSSVMKDKVKFFFKSCAKCGGDMVEDRDCDGYFRKCLQCGRIVDYETAAPLEAKADDKRLVA